MLNVNYVNPENKNSYNPVRILEWILCFVCLVLAIYISFDIDELHTLIKIVLIQVSGAFCLITLVDIIIRRISIKSFLWTSWIIFATVAVLTFFLCAGLLLLLFRHLGTPLCVISAMANGLTGLIFLMDLHHMVWLIVGEALSKENYVIEKLPTSLILKKKTYDKACQFPANDDLQLSSIDKCTQCQCDIRKEKFVHEVFVTKYSPITTSFGTHGGTFHVSKDVAPVITSYAGTLEQKGPSNIQGKTRTVATLAKPILSKQGKTNDTFNVIRKDVLPNRPRSSPVCACQTGTHWIDVCSCCEEGSFREPAKPTSASYPVSARCQKLPTLQECPCYSSESEEESSHEIYPSPISLGSNKEALSSPNSFTRRQEVSPKTSSTLYSPLSNVECYCSSQPSPNSPTSLVNKSVENIADSSSYTRTAKCNEKSFDEHKITKPQAALRSTDCQTEMFQNNQEVQTEKNKEPNQYLNAEIKRIPNWRYSNSNSEGSGTTYVCDEVTLLPGATETNEKRNGETPKLQQTRIIDINGDTISSVGYLVPISHINQNPNLKRRTVQKGSKCAIL